jgi:diguanylate cyclase (GGDEF)-like protein
MVLQKRFDPGTGLTIELPDASNSSYTVLVRVVSVRPQAGDGWRTHCNFVSELSENDVERLIRLTGNDSGHMSRSESRTALGSSPQEAQARMCGVYLLIIQGRPEGKRLSFPRGQYLFGRGSECHIRPNSDWVSKRHCQLIVDVDKVSIRDLGSRNGTLVNGERVVGERSLQEGDQVQVGPLVFQICLEPVNKPDTPPVSARPKPGDTQAHCLDTQGLSLDTVGRSSMSDTIGSRAPESAAREPDTQSSIDPLTGLLNREAIDDLARLQLRAGRRLALGLIDLDRFRAINLRYSHLGGDAVLIAVARILNSVLPAGSSVGRLGCEHFLVLAPEATVEEVAMLAERIRSAVQQERFAYKDQVIEATVSIGFAVAEAGVAAGYHQMRGVAAAALAEAKSAGRNRGVV